MSKKVWCFDPHSGGTRIPKEMHSKIIKDVHDFEKTRAWYPRIRLDIRFKSQFCYINTIEKEENLSPLLRLRYFNTDWSIGFFSWASERYEPCVFQSGEWLGSIEDAIKLCELIHLN